MKTLSVREPVRLSRWVHLFFKKEINYFAIYHSLTLETIFLEKKFRGLIGLLKIGTTVEYLVKRFSFLPEQQIKELCQELYSNKMISLVLENDMKMLNKKVSKHVLSPGLETLYLITTDYCNLRCKYCLINNNMLPNYKHSVMTWDVAKEAIDMFFLNISKNPPEYNIFVKMIVFYGGEPLLNFDLIRKVVEYVKDVYKEELKKLEDLFRFTIISNGTVINEEIASFLSKHKDINIAISLDGPQKINDSKRVFVNNLGTFEKIIQGYNLLKSIGGYDRIAISCTIDSHNINSLPELLKLQSKYNFSAINLNPLLDTKQNKVSKSHMSKVSKKMLEYFVLARQKGVYEDRIMRKVNSFVNKEIYAFDCQATGAQIVCSPDGSLGVCHEGIGARNFFFSKVSRNFDFHNNSVVKEWKLRTPLNMPQCWDCPSLGICGGGCAYSAQLRNGSIWSVDDRFCVHSKTTLEWLIWDLFNVL